MQLRPVLQQGGHACALGADGYVPSGVRHSADDFAFALGGCASGVDHRGVTRLSWAKGCLLGAARTEGFSVTKTHIPVVSGGPPSIWASSHGGRVNVAPVGRAGAARHVCRTGTAVLRDFLSFAMDWEHRFEPRLPLYVQVSRSAAVLALARDFHLELDWLEDAAWNYVGGLCLGAPRPTLCSPARAGHTGDGGRCAGGDPQRARLPTARASRAHRHPAERRGRRESTADELAGDEHLLPG
ncbi:glyoxalase superfamily protein [Streptomyces sparsogenes]|uniref:glyoxalase superfamily protein n=1 Tax=Streptomyces sparsogenes TaxID=67365 RepID=UPI0033DD9B19